MSFFKNLFQGIVVAGAAASASVIGAEATRQFLENVKKKKAKAAEENSEEHDEIEDGGEAKVEVKK